MAWSLFSQSQVSPLSWATSLLQAGGFPQTAANLQSIIAWALLEGGGGQYNPLNTTLQTAGSVGSINSAGVQDYASWQDGIQATIQTLQSGYPTIVADLKSGKGIGSNASGDLSKWSGSGYSALRAVWQRAAQYLKGKAVPLPAGGTQTATLDSASISDITGAVQTLGTLLHDTAMAVNFAVDMIRPGQPWRVATGITAGAASIGAVKLYGARGDDALPMIILLAGIATVAAYMTFRPWPQPGGKPIRPAAYVIDIIEGKAPATQPLPNDTTAIEAGLGVIAGVWVTSKIANAAASGGNIISKLLGPILGGLGKILGKLRGATADIPPVVE